MSINGRDLPQGWAVAALPSLVSPAGLITDGDWVESKDQNPSGRVRLTQLADVGDGVFRDKSARFLTEEKCRALRCTPLERNDVLVARMPDPLGRACLFPGSAQTCVTVVDVCVVRPGSDAIRPRWLMYFINAPQFRSDVAALQSGSTRKRISKKNFCTVEMPVPPTAEQERLASALESYFSRLDDAVASLERVQRNLKRYCASVLKAAVEGRLVPTEAELARQEGRDYEPADVLLTRILKERRRRWEEAELVRMTAKGKPPKDDKWKTKYKEPVAPDTGGLPELPEGWCWSSLGQSFDVVIGATPSRRKNEYWGGTIHWVSSGEVAFCRITSTRETITESGLSNSSTKLNPVGTVLIGMIGEGKTRGQAAILDIPACNNQNAAAIRVSESGMIPEFVYWYLVGQYEQTRTLGSGNNQPALNKSRVQAMPIPLAPIAEQRRISESLEQEASRLDRIERDASSSIARSHRLRQSILKWAFEGKLVDQDPTDEPASVLLERIKAERAAAESKKPQRKTHRKKKTTK